MSIIRKYYDRNYYNNKIVGKGKGSKRNKKRLGEILRYTRGGRLFEIGCGVGGFLDVASEHFEVSGIDISGYAVEDAKKRFKGRVSEGDISKVRLKADHYDVIAGFNILEHIRDFRSVVSKVYASLRSGGIFIGSFPNKSWLIGRAFTGFVNFLDRTHCSTLKPAEWRRIFEDAGFSKIEFFGEIVLPGGASTYVRGRYWALLSMNLVFVCRK